MNKELETKFEVSGFYVIEVMSRHLPGGNEENHIKIQSAYQVPWRRLRPRLQRYCYRVDTDKSALKLGAAFSPEILALSHKYVNRWNDIIKH
jgi:hypothetical protein